MSDVIETSPVENELHCSECNNPIGAGQAYEKTDDGVFCPTCYGILKQQVQQAVATQSEDINYPKALIFGVAGAALGVLVWWGFTVGTNIAFGLVAIVIGLAVGKGVVIGAGQKRAIGLQALSVGISTLAFFYASYLVNRSFLMQAYAEENQVFSLPLLPNPELAYHTISLGFQVMDLVFLAIVLWEAWKIPAPLQVEE